MTRVILGIAEIVGEEVEAVEEVQEAVADEVVEDQMIGTGNEPHPRKRTKSLLRKSLLGLMRILQRRSRALLV